MKPRTDGYLFVLKAEGKMFATFAEEFTVASAFPITESGSHL